jgi:hypothetical protein
MSGCPGHLMTRQAIFGRPGAAVPDSTAEYPMWVLSLPWYAVYAVTVPDCGKEAGAYTRPLFSIT